MANSLLQFLAHKFPKPPFLLSPHLLDISNLILCYLSVCLSVCSHPPPLLQSLSSCPTPSLVQAFSRPFVPHSHTLPQDCFPAILWAQRSCLLSVCQASHLITYLNRCCEIGAWKPGSWMSVLPALLMGRCNSEHSSVNANLVLLWLT